jgi:hypothetical protein
MLFWFKYPKRVLVANLWFVRNDAKIWAVWAGLTPRRELQDWAEGSIPGSQPTNETIRPN